MRDNTRTPLERGPKGADERVRTVESARQAVEVSTLHACADEADLPGARPAHTAGVFLVGTFEPMSDSLPFTTSLFDGDRKWVLARFSPLRTVNENGRYDLHGLSLRMWSGDNDADYTDLVALNTRPFMFRTVDEFTTVTRLLQSPGLKDKATGFTEFLAATLAGDASVHGAVNAIRAAMGGNNPLPGRSYWGIHTFFADRDDPERGSRPVRVPYRYWLAVCEGRASDQRRSKGRILARYRNLVNRVRDGQPIDVDLWFALPWRWERLLDWADVPERTRQDIINPQAVWKNVSKKRIGRITLHAVADGNAAWGIRTEDAYDRLLFDPTRLTDGLHISEDPMLVALSSIYAESHMRRT